MTDHIVPNHYIVVFKSETEDEKVDAHCTWAHELHTSRVSAFSTEESGKYAGVKHKYNKIAGFRGYAGSFDDATKAEIEAAEEVSPLSLLPPLSLPLYTFYITLARRILILIFLKYRSNSWSLILRSTPAMLSRRPTCHPGA